MITKLLIISIIINTIVKAPIPPDGSCVFLSLNVVLS